jgi:DNA-directed RNA polymerase subunit M/transcription elongation factor TFIIS
MLPKLDVPIYNIKLISTGQEVRIRPFLVKEQKLFLMAAESEDSKETINTIKQVLKNCILDDINVDILPTFDLEYLFMNLRARSVEEIVNLKYKCNNTIKNDKNEDTVCNGSVEFDVNLLQIEPTKHPEHSSKFLLNDKIGISLKYPTFEMVQKYEQMDENDIMVNILIDCIDYLYDDEQVYYSKDSSRKELEDFVDSMQQKDLEKIRVFFDTMPEIKKDVHFHCPKCGYEEEMVIKGLQNFFA